MPSMMILDAAQAASLRGPTAPGSALDPRPLVDGTFALPIAVRDDPAHAGVHGILQDLPQREVAAEEWLPDQGA
jgi:hypothetical protein